MSHRTAAHEALPHPSPASTTAPRMCLAVDEDRAAATDGRPETRLFPPRDADAETRAAWLARSPWPEIVFACAR